MMERKAFVYVGKDSVVSLLERTAYKIGSTYDVKQRQRSVYIGEVLFTIECDSRIEAYGLEFRLHRYFNYRAVPRRNEWFYLTDDEIELIRGGFDGRFTLSEFTLMFAYHHLRRHDSAGDRVRVTPEYAAWYRAKTRGSGINWFDLDTVLEVIGIEDDGDLFLQEFSEPRLGLFHKGWSPPHLVTKIDAPAESEG